LQSKSNGNKIGSSEMLQKTSINGC